MPDAGMFAVGDQLAVAGHDLGAALRTARGRAGGGGRARGGGADTRAAASVVRLRCDRARRAVPRRPAGSDALSRLGQSEAMTRSARM